MRIKVVLMVVVPLILVIFGIPLVLYLLGKPLLPNIHCSKFSFSPSPIKESGFYCPFGCKVETVIYDYSDRTIGNVPVGDSDRCVGWKMPEFACRRLVHLNEEQAFKISYTLCQECDGAWGLDDKTYGCNPRMWDYGKKCKNSSDCLGWCDPEDMVKVAGEGECSPYKFTYHCERRVVVGGKIETVNVCE